MSEKVNIEKLKIVTSEFRLSHPRLFKPQKMKDKKGKEVGELKFSIEMLFDKKTTKVSELQKPIRAAIEAKWGPDKEEWPSPLKTPIKDGDKPRGPKKEVKPEHKGMWVVRADTLAEYGKPYTVGRDPKVIIETESELYPGCYCRAALKATTYQMSDENTGVKFILDGVQFIRDGKALSSRKPADQVFGVIEGDDGDETLGGDSETSFSDATDEAQEESFM